MGKKYAPAPENLEPTTFHIHDEEFTFTPVPTGGLMTKVFKSRQSKSADIQTVNREILTWLGRGLAVDHEPFRDAPGHSEENRVEGCQGCRVEIMLEDGLLNYGTLIEIATDLMGEVANRPPTKSTTS